DPDAGEVPHRAASGAARHAHPHRACSDGGGAGTASGDVRLGAGVAAPHRRRRARLRERSDPARRRRVRRRGGRGADRGCCRRGRRPGRRPRLPRPAVPARGRWEAMRIHRLRLVDFRGIAEREITLPDSGVVVLQGENEVGKTSMIEAIDLLLDKADSSKAREVRAGKPVNRDVGPLVAAELSCGPYRFTYTKRWLRETRTELPLTAPQPASLTGAEAHAEVQRILTETLDTSLYQALRVLQAGELTSAALADSSALAAALDRAAGTAGHDEDGDALLAAVDAEYATYFTPTGRETGEYAAARKEASAAEATCTEAEARLRQLQQDVDSHARLTTELAAISDHLAQARRDREAHEQAWHELTTLRQQVTDAREKVRSRSREHAWLSEAAERRATAGRALETKIAAWEELTRRLTEAREELHQARAEQREASNQVAAAQEEEQHLRQKVEAA